MPRVCTVCASPNRTAIDAALANGEGKRTIANRYSLSDSAVLGHRHACARPVIERRLRARDVRLEHLVDDLLDARELAKRRMHECIARDADADAARWSRELRDGNVVIGKLSGLYRESGPTVANTQVNVFANWSGKALETFEALLESGDQSAVLQALAAPTTIENDEDTRDD